MKKLRLGKSCDEMANSRRVNHMIPYGCACKSSSHDHRHTARLVLRVEYKTRAQLGLEAFYIPSSCIKVVSVLFNTVVSSTLVS